MREKFEAYENGGLFLAIIFGMIGMLTLGVTASSLELYRSINAVQSTMFEAYPALPT